MNTLNENRISLSVESGDYPALYQAADKASVEAQRKHLLIVRLYLGLLVASAVSLTYATQTKWMSVVAALLFLSTLGLAILQAFKDHEKTWYNGRAVAESVKTSAWRYMMRAEPYSDAESIEMVRREFCNDLKQILKQNRSLAEHIGGDISTRAPIPEKMDKVRSLDVEDRLNIYNESRIDEQRRWYAKKYTSNKKKATRWFYGMILLHAVAAGILIVQIEDPNLGGLPTNAVIVAAGSILTWIRTKKHKENATAYSLTAHEIGLIKQESASVVGEADLSDFVKDSENAFSREHTQWVAQKDK